ncbi:hypothetical protein [Maridesulfovibrio sp.]|uniref:hypothetical protein n=1 Tax=Maridesulfovibrio sp. TaxID=2795000 RepID=UPI002AA811E9|nr:hypothetical protein [Maridesulfovibrio sp.]
MRNWFNGKTMPRPARIDSVMGELSSAFEMDKETALDLFESIKDRPWANVVTPFKLGYGVNYPYDYDYFAEMICSVEDVCYQAAEARERGKKDWMNCLRESDLPDDFFGEYYRPAWERIGNKPIFKNKKLLLHPNSAALFLSLSLFLLSAFDVAWGYGNARVRGYPIYMPLLGGRSVLWFHNFLPDYSGGKVDLPMKRYIRFIMRCLKVTSIRELSSILPSLTKLQCEKDISSQKRQIFAWMKGDPFPSWETIIMIRDTFFCKDDRLLIDYGVTRFLHTCFDSIRKMDVPSLFENDAELVTVFQSQYSKWQNYHELNYVKWFGDKVRNRPCHQN